MGKKKQNDRCPFCGSANFESPTSPIEPPPAERSERRQTEGHARESSAEPAARLQRPDAAASLESILLRAGLFLEDGEWERADLYFESALDRKPECAEAYVGKMLAELRFADIPTLARSESVGKVRESRIFEKAVRFAEVKAPNKKN